MAISQVQFAYQDGTGNFFLSTYLSGTDGTGVNIFLKDLSNAGVLYSTVAVRDLTYQSEGSNAPFPSVTQLAQLVFTDSIGSTGVLTIPAPVASIFQADGVTVDTSNLDIALLIANATLGGRMLSAAGNPVTAYLRGARVGRGAT